MKAAMQKHGHNDWCHLCGKRNDNNVGIWFPENAEHDAPVKPGPARAEEGEEKERQVMNINQVSDVEPAYRKLLMTNAVVRHAWQTAMENDFTSEETLKYIICSTAHIIDERIKDDLEKLNAAPGHVIPTTCPYCKGKR